MQADALKDRAKISGLETEMLELKDIVRNFAISPDSGATSSSQARLDPSSSTQTQSIQITRRSTKPMPAQAFRGSGMQYSTPRTYKFLPPMTNFEPVVCEANISSARSSFSGPPAIEDSTAIPLHEAGGQPSERDISIPSSVLTVLSIEIFSSSCFTVRWHESYALEKGDAITGGDHESRAVFCIPSSDR
ncbi:uncharacterized protein LAESUDRAFT_763480 [Laetiporus sulphureus 93-53]|uniref:Uncharacterized protein n=1 Tax=Laetiporus sulphureus 93-53 TaxID=1314785 RepID=A0A165BVS0_9APHY|nr:uncharacterized protein LAESUDRAFT_763480 [Laetiporus sulphureus 93-53]KZT01741.1 hypothetical protein LAESUDRAFT_763480 [Laetiporus sulphureus 93-53]